MSNYTKTTNFLAKDSLPGNDSGKIIKGSEFDTEFNNLQTAVNTKADIASPALTGVPTAPTATAGTNTTQLATTAFVHNILFPSGGIIIWSGSSATIPSGWLLCNGTSGTPDLRDRFVIGAGSTYAVGATGGSADAIVVSHTHTATVTDPGHFHAYGQGQRVQVGEDNGVAYDAETGSTFNTQSKTTGISVSNSSTGSSGTNANLPPYYALCYIMKS